MARARPKTPAPTPAAASSNGRRSKTPKAGAPEPPPETKPVVHTLVAQPHGGSLRVGNPGNRGRPPEKFTELMQALANRQGAVAILEGILDGRCAIETKGGIMLVDGRLFLDTHKHVTAEGYGRPAIAAKGGRSVLRIEFVRE